MSTFSELYAQQREQARTHVVRRERTRRPVLAVVAGALGAAAGRAQGAVQRYRRAGFYSVGFGFIDYGVFTWNDVGGYIAIGLSVLVLDALSGGDAQ